MNTEQETNNPEDELSQRGETGYGNPNLNLDGAFESDGQMDANQESDPANSEQSMIADLQDKLAEAEKKILLGHADQENFRRRTRKDAQDQVRYAPLKLIGELLESVDNLHRAIESYANDPNSDSLAEGVKIVADQITATLESHGCKKIDAVGQPFDPSFHQAVQMQPSEEFPANTVMMDLRPGFRLHDRVVRPSQVFVSTGAE